MEPIYNEEQIRQWNAIREAHWASVLTDDKVIRREGSSHNGKKMVYYIEKVLIERKEELKEKHG